MFFRSPKNQNAEKTLLRSLFVDYSQILANLLVLFALPFTVLTYCHQLDTEKVSRSLEYVNDFNRGDMLSARNILLNIWQRGEQPSEDLPGDALAELFDRLADRDGMKPDSSAARQAISDIANFFDMVEACRSSGACDAANLEKNLGPYAHDFWCIYQGNLTAQRLHIGNKRLGNGLQSFALSQGDC